MNCLCSNNDYSIIYNLPYPIGTQIIQCRSCGLYRTQPTPIDGKLKILDYSGLEREPKICKKRRYQAHKKIIRIIKKGLFPTSKISVLDIGCSVGHFMKYANENGLSCFGLDIDIDAINYGHHKLNLGKLCIAEAIALPFRKDTFDAIILNHTLEHLHDPIKVLKQIGEVLKPRGILIIIIPYIRGLIPKLRPFSWPSLRPEMHLWHFTPRIITQLLKNAGFKIINLRLTRINTPLISSIMRRIAYDIISRFGCAIGLGDEIFLISRKE